MTADLEMAMNSATDLSSSLDDIDYYLSLSRMSFSLTVGISSLIAAVLFAEIIVERIDYHLVNTGLWSVNLYGVLGFDGTFLNLAVALLFVGSIFLYLYTRYLKKSIQRNEVKKMRFERNKGKDELVRFVTGIEWDETLERMQRAKISFSIYSISLVAVYSLIIYFLLSLILQPVPIGLLDIGLFGGKYARFIFFDIFVPAVSMLLSLLIQRGEIRKAIGEFHRIKSILAQLREFDEEFKRSGIQA